jgi:hypothetical protein
MSSSSDDVNVLYVCSDSKTYRNPKYRKIVQKVLGHHMPLNEYYVGDEVPNNHESDSCSALIEEWDHCSFRHVKFDVIVSEHCPLFFKTVSKHHKGTYSFIVGEEYSYRVLLGIKTLIRQNLKPGGYFLYDHSFDNIFEEISGWARLKNLGSIRSSTRPMNVVMKLE